MTSSCNASSRWRSFSSISPASSAAKRAAFRSSYGKSACPVVPVFAGCSGLVAPRRCSGYDAAVRLPQGYRPLPTESGPIGLPGSLPLLILVNSVLFPRAPAVVRVRRAPSVDLVRELADDAVESAIAGVVAQRTPTEWPSLPGDLFHVGCAARLIAVREDGGDISVLLQGGPLFRVTEAHGDTRYLVARVVPFPVPESPPSSIDEASRLVLYEVAEALLEAELGERTAARDLLESLRHPSDVASVCLYGLELPIDEQQELLLAGPDTRLRRAVGELVTGLRATKAREQLLARARS
ncbi:MAG: LON peptidase substrate-binding domain-containing protein [Myxococcaceae bacterium]